MPWPVDAVMVVAALAGTERRGEMKGVHPCACRDCGASLHADTFTVRTAEGLPERHGRPIKFFCLACHAGYDLTRFDALVDHSGGRGRAIREGGAQ